MIERGGGLFIYYGMEAPLTILSFIFFELFSVKNMLSFGISLCSPCKWPSYTFITHGTLEACMCTNNLIEWRLVELFEVFAQKDIVISFLLECLRIYLHLTFG